MKSWLTQEEYDKLLLDDLIAGGKPPLLYRHVSHGQLSIARYSGGARINGAAYTYIHPTDELLRDDALKALVKMRKDAAESSEPKSEQKSLL